MTVLSRQVLLDSLHYLMQSLTRKEFAALYESNNVGQYNIDRRVQEAHYKLLQLADNIIYDFSFLPEELRKEWESFAKHKDLSPTQENKIAYGELVKKTLQYLEYIKSIPRQKKRLRFTDGVTNATPAEEPKNVRTMDGEQMQLDLKRLDVLLQAATQKLEEARKKGEPNKEEIVNLDRLIKTYQAKILALREDKDAHESDKKTEQEWDTRLTTSFDELDKKSSSLNFDIRIARLEYIACISLMAVATVWFLCWYKGFYDQLTAPNSTIQITSWITYLPYALPVTAYIAIMWILIVQKNRASKISISLSTRTANVHYLEGLMKLVNRLSKDTTTATGRINTIVEKMIDSYLRQLETSNVTEKKIEKIEEKEQNDVPQQKIFNELKKHITHD